MVTMSPNSFVVIDGNSDGDIKIEMMFKDNMGVKLRITAPKSIKVDRVKFSKI